MTSGYLYRIIEPHSSPLAVLASVIILLLAGLYHLIFVGINGPKGLSESLIILITWRMFTGGSEGRSECDVTFDIGSTCDRMNSS